MLNCSSMNGLLRKVQLIHIGKVSFLSKTGLFQRKVASKEESSI